MATVAAGAIVAMVTGWATLHTTEVRVDALEDWRVTHTAEASERNDNTEEYRREQAEIVGRIDVNLEWIKKHIEGSKPAPSPPPPVAAVPVPKAAS